MGECADEREVLCEKVSIGGRMRWVWISCAVRCEWAHLGLGFASECGRETLLDRGVEVMIILAVGSPVLRWRCLERRLRWSGRRNAEIMKGICR